MYSNQLDVMENYATSDDVDDYRLPLTSRCRQHVMGEQHTFEKWLPSNLFGLDGPITNKKKSYMYLGGQSSSRYMFFDEAEPDYPLVRGNESPNAVSCNLSTSPHLCDKSEVDRKLPQ